MHISSREWGEPGTLLTLPKQAGNNAAFSAGIKSLCWNCEVLV